MKLAYSTLGCPDWQWEDVVSAAADLGYDGIEVRGLLREMYAPRMSVFQPDRRDATLAQLKRLGLTIPCLASFATLQNGGEEALTEGRDYIDLARAIGTPYVRVLGDKNAGPGAPVNDSIVAVTLTKLCDHAKDTGVTVLIETSGCYGDTARLRALVTAVDRPELAVLWDVHHPFRFFGESPEDTVRNIGPWVRHVHIKDSVMTPSGPRYRMLGDGDLPLQAFVDALAGLKYEGFITLEWVKRWDPTLEDPGVAFANFVHFMGGLIKQGKR